MGFSDILKSLFGNKSTRDLKKIMPVVEKINAVYPEIEKLTNDELRSRIDAVRKRSQDSIADKKAEIANVKEEQKVATTVTSDVQSSIKVAEENATTEQNYVLNYYDANKTAETLLKFSENGVILAIASNPATPEPPTDDLPEVTDWVKALPTGYTEATFLSLPFLSKRRIPSALA